MTGRGHHKVFIGTAPDVGKTNRTGASTRSAVNVVPFSSADASIAETGR
jgi:hypothetical protein